MGPAVGELSVRLVACVVALVCATLPGTAPAPRPSPGDEQGDERYELSRVESIVEQAHRYLVDNQNADGSFSAPRSQAAKSAPVAVTSLAAMSLMAGGHVPDRGRHGQAVDRAVRWLVQHCSAEGVFRDDNDTISKMHGQGYALLALTQAYGASGRREDQAAMRDAIVRGIRLVERTQGEIGGWYYEPVKSSAHEGSITVCMIQALRAARDAGFSVNIETIRRAERYMVQSQDEVDGRFRYAINDPKKTWALTAAALSTLNAMGDYGSDRLELGFDALKRHDPFLDRGRFAESFQDYGALYAAQAYWQYRDRKEFERWWPAFVDDCERRQRAHPDGGFKNITYGDVYATAIVSLTLTVPLGYLPIFQR